MLAFSLADCSASVGWLIALCIQGYPGLDGRKGESGGAGLKVSRPPSSTLREIPSLLRDSDV